MANLKNILIAPLDWGLGHATRIIPLITNLLQQNCTIYIAGEGATQSLLKKEFPEAKFLPLRGYRIRYSSKKAWLPLTMALQIPGVFIRIFKEQQWLKKVVKQYSIDLVISDNRFGLYHSAVTSIYITHQLRIKTGNLLTENFLQRCHYWFIQKYSCCWVPDFEGADNIAGKLSHPERQLSNVSYIGGLSRFKRNYTGKILYDLMVLLSGPEPQRTVLENALIPKLLQFEGKVLLVRGLPEEKKELGIANPSVKISNHLAADELSAAMEQSAIVVCRSGYTTVMDLLKLQKKAILVPTPGQTEQEYLGRYLMKRHLFLTAQQKNFSLTKELQNAAAFNFSAKDYDMEKYKTVIAQLINNWDERKK